MAELGVMLFSEARIVSVITLNEALSRWCGPTVIKLLLGLQWSGTAEVGGNSDG